MRKVVIFILGVFTLIPINVKAYSSEPLYKYNNYGVCVSGKVLPKKVYEEVGFTINESTYPQISGLTNKSFQGYLNYLIESKVKSGVSEFQNKVHDMIGTYNGNVFFSYNVMFFKKNFLILSLNIHSEGLWGGNNWSSNEDYYFIDLKKSKLVKSIQGTLKGNLISIAFINSSIRNFFNKEFNNRKDLSIDYPDASSNISELDLVIKDDMLCLMTKQTPAGHVSQNNFCIPLIDFKAALHDDYKYLIEE
ncbi:hypothetical protein L3049_10635 [Labilibaculum sp. DW002]|uniref:Deacetylase PdaC domain-containing protein n=1 Tax=Paralabilibaculum antarcticum TaxID=2912572 RepID=A0ABT5VSR3_9BACT|nr:hypothetical protein [Labilibaculum sp. DW002]MDE5418465.1 hypothetical protein [Labilibaculum sp. DW002]